MPEGPAGGWHAHWRDMGRGDDPALMIHCSLAHLGAWNGLAAALDDRLRMRAFDLPGHGRSGDWDQTAPYQQVTCDIAAALMDDASPGRPVHLMGHSFGATAALRLAVARPDRIASLTLIETVFFSIVRLDAPETLAESDARNRPFAEARARGDDAAAARAFHAVWGDGRAWDTMPEHLRETLTRRIPLIDAVSATNNGDPLNMLAERKLEALQVPVLLVEGAESPSHIALINDGLERRLPKATRARIENAAHMAPITHPAEVAAHIRPFLDRVQPRQS